MRRTMGTTKSRAKAPKAKRAAKVPNALTEAADDAQRKLLRAALKRSTVAGHWNLSHVATELRLSGGPAVIQYLKRLMPEEYIAAQEDGRIKAGARPKA